MATFKSFLIRPVCFGEKRGNIVFIISKFLPSVLPSLRPQGSLTWNCINQNPPPQSLCSMIKDIIENVNTRRLKIAFTLNHTKMCLKIPSWLRGKWKFMLFAFHCIVFKRQRKSSRQHCKCACFQTSATSPFCWGPGSMRGFVHMQVQRSLTNNHSELLRIRKPERQRWQIFLQTTLLLSS